MQALRVGIFGGGIVGGGAYELIQAAVASGKLAQLGANIEIAKICVRSLDKPRDFTVASSTKFVTRNHLPFPFHPRLAAPPSHLRGSRAFRRTYHCSRLERSAAFGG